MNRQTSNVLIGLKIATLVSIFNVQVSSAQSANSQNVFDFNFQSGVHSQDINGDGRPDVVTIGYISGGSGYSQYDFNFLIDLEVERPGQQRYFTVLPDSESRNNFITLQNADCVLKSIRLVRLGENQEDWKLLIIERKSVPEAGYTESPVEFRILKLQAATSAGSSRFSYRQTGNVDSAKSYCNVGDAFREEWDSVAPVLSNTL